MIVFLKGNILKAQTEALVNTVNTVGVMGKGIALQFKENFPENYKLYKQAAERGEIAIGKMFVTATNRLDGIKYIVNFPTKKEWFRPSGYQYIEEGLTDFIATIKKYNIKSVAIPPLGCGQGGLNWNKVRPMLVQALSNVPDVDAHIFEPDAEVNSILQKQDEPKEVKLTPARAMLLFALFRHEANREEASLFAANKLSYFLQRLGEKQLKLNFVRHLYGPYSNQVDHLMYTLNGKYLTGLEQRNAKAFDSIHLNYTHYTEVKDFVNNKLSPEEKNHLNSLFQFIDGFQSPLSLEALSSVDMLLSENPDKTPDDIFASIQTWSARKKILFSKRHIEIAYQHIQEYKAQLFPQQV